MQDYRYTSRDQCIVSKSHFLQDNQHTSRDQCIVSPTLCRTIDTLVESNVSLFLLFVGLSIHQSRSAFHQSYFFVGLPFPVVQSSVSIVLPLSQSDSRYSDQEPCVGSTTILGLLIRWPSDYRNDRTTAMAILVGYFNDFSLITSCLAFLGTISN